MFADSTHHMKKVTNIYYKCQSLSPRIFSPLAPEERDPDLIASLMSLVCSPLPGGLAVEGRGLAIDGTGLV